MSEQLIVKVPNLTPWPQGLPMHGLPSEVGRRDLWICLLQAAVRESQLLSFRCGEAPGQLLGQAWAPWQLETTGVSKLSLFTVNWVGLRHRTHFFSVAETGLNGVWQNGLQVGFVDLSMFRLSEATTCTCWFGDKGLTIEHKVRSAFFFLVAIARYLKLSPFVSITRCPKKAVGGTRWDTGLPVRIRPGHVILDLCFKRLCRRLPRPGCSAGDNATAAPVFRISKLEVAGATALYRARPTSPRSRQCSWTPRLASGGVAAGGTWYKDGQACSLANHG